MMPAAMMPARPSDGCPERFAAERFAEFFEGFALARPRPRIDVSDARR